MVNLDSISKTLEYIHLSAKPTVVLSTGFFRGYTCPVGCGGCCKPVTLTFIDNSQRWEKFKKLYPSLVLEFELEEVQGVRIWVDRQKENKSRFCRHLDLSTGRCNIHSSNPFPCEFVLSKFIDNQARNRSILTTTNYGRGWSFLRVDHSTRGAMCEITTFSYKKLLRDIELLEELWGYARQFQIKTKLPYILLYLIERLEEFKTGNLPKQNIEFKQENIVE